MLVDANILLYAVDATSAHHHPAAEWLVEAMNGPRRVALTWSTIGAFLRIATHPRVFAQPLSGSAAADHVEQWLSRDQVWIPAATERTAALLQAVVRRHGVTGNLVTDAQLVAIAVEHGLSIVSADSDFARFPEIAWDNPLSSTSP